LSGLNQDYGKLIRAVAGIAQFRPKALLASLMRGRMAARCVRPTPGMAAIDACA
jgi:hypothetical protein